MSIPNPYIDEDLEALAEMAGRFATDRLAPGFTERDHTRTLDPALMRPGRFDRRKCG